MNLKSGFGGAAPYILSAANSMSDVSKAVAFHEPVSISIPLEGRTSAAKL
jgi:hypothetical protein